MGRLATYRYLNLDQVVGQVLATFRRIEAEVPLAHSAALAETTSGDFAFKPANHGALAPLVLRGRARP